MFALPGSTSWQPLTLARTWTTRLQAHGNGTTYQVFLHVPASAAQTQGLPVIYLLDGDDLFIGAAELLRRAARRPESTGIAPAILVGIGHADAPNAAGNSKRRRDYTPGPCATETVNGASGGAAALLAFITEQLVPTIEADMAIDSTRRALIGHSLAGYFCLWALTRQTTAFTHFAAISPSIWWNPAAIMPQSISGAQLYLAVGEWERDPAPWQHKLASNPAALERRQRRDMIGHVRRLADTCARQWPDRTVQLDLLAGEDHATVVDPALTRALRFVQQTPGGAAVAPRTA